MGTKYVQLTENERHEIFCLHSDRIYCSEIGRMIGRELRRNALPKSGYLPFSAERMALGRRHRKRQSKIERSSQLAETVRIGEYDLRCKTRLSSETDSIEFIWCFRCINQVQNLAANPPCAPSWRGADQTAGLGIPSAHISRARRHRADAW